MRLVDDSDDGRRGEKQGMGHVRRARSSLDYKVKNTGSLTTTKPGKRKNPHQQLQEEEEQQMRQQQQQQQQTTFRYHHSRSRGHAGPPPKRYELSDLEHLSREEAMHALYSDPELAQEAARMAENMSAKEKQGSAPSKAPTTSAKSKSRRTGGGNYQKKTKGASANKEFSEYPDHLRELMDGGVPVLQWVILLVLLGAALYQLRKILTLPDTKDSVKARGVRGGGKVGPKKSTKKAKGTGSAPEVTSSELATVEEAVRAIEEELTAPLPNGKKASKKTGPSAPSKKKKKVKQANNGSTTTTTAKSQLTDATGTPEEEESSSKPATVNPVTAPMQTATTSETEDSGAGWQTVSKVRATSEVAVAAADPPAVQKKEVSPTAAEQPASTKPQIPEEEDVAVDGKKENTPPAMNGSSAGTATANKKKKKKMSKELSAAADSSVPSASNGVASKGEESAARPTTTTLAVAKSTTENDEALAKKLQLEEVNMAHGGTTANGATETQSNDAWEEVKVTTRSKRKGTKQENDAA